MPSHLSAQALPSLFARRFCKNARGDEGPPRWSGRGDIGQPTSAAGRWLRTEPGAPLLRGGAEVLGSVGFPGVEMRFKS